MVFGLSQCLVFIAVVYFSFLCFGIGLFRVFSRIDPGKTQYHRKLNTIMRFCIYVLLVPLAMTCALCIFIVYIADAGLF